MKPIYRLLIVVIIGGPSLSLNQTGVYSIQWCGSTDTIQQRLIECTATATTDHLVKLSVQQSKNLNTNVTSQLETTVSLTCDVPATLSTVIFCAWACSGTSPSDVVSQKLESFMTNWQSKSSQVPELRILMKVSKELETLIINFKVTKPTTINSSLRYAIFDESFKPLYHGVLVHEVTKGHTKFKRASSSGNIVSGYLVVANRLYLHHIHVDGSRSKVAVSGLGNAVGVDFHFRNNSLFWTDSSQRAIMKSTLEGLNKNTVLNRGLTQPDSLSVDWISSKLYWIDVRERQIGVLDLVRWHHKLSLISTDPDTNPGGLAVDPTTGSLFWTEWSRSIARIQKGSMDGNDVAILFENNLQRPHAVSVDYADQILYWADAGLDRIESANVDGSNRRVVISSGLNEPFDLTILGDMIYISDINLGILAANKSGHQPVEVIYDRFCEHVGPVGIQAVAQERQLLASNPCENNNGGCSHLCLLSLTDPRGFSCACPDEMTLRNDNTTCSQSMTNITSANSTKLLGSCRSAGFTSCCPSSMCRSSSLCFCDSDCYRYGDCCDDIEEICLPQSESDAYLLVSNILYIHQISLDGSRIKTVYSTNSLENIIAIDYNYRTNNMYWSTSNENKIWQSQLNGSQAISFHINDVHTIEDIAVDWISNKLYWTDSGTIDRIRVLDLSSGHYVTLIDTGADTGPRAIVVDPINRCMYWSDWGAVAKIESASMDGRNRRVIHNTDLIQPNGLTLDHSQQILYWNDANLDKIESSRVDGSNRRIVSNQRIYKPFGISVYRDRLYFTDLSVGVNTIPLVNGVGSVDTVLDSLCENIMGIEVVSTERQPAGTNICMVGNGGCSHLCLLSSVNASGYSCACPDNLRLSEDARTCISDSTVPPVTPFIGHGTCAAAGYTGGCCTSGACRGSPPTCSCDSTCHLFQDCCEDVPPSCQPATNVLEFSTIPSNVSVILGPQTQHIRSQFYCSVRASRVTNFEWTFRNKSQSPSTQYQISNELVASTDFASTLTIESVLFSDAGVYTCIASIDGTLNPIEASAHLIVEVLPSISEISGNVVYNSEQAISLSCQVEAYPRPMIFWAFKTSTKIQSILNTSRSSVLNTYLTIEEGRPFSRSQLIINNVNSNDSGDYLCIATAAVKHVTARSRVHSVTVTMNNKCEDPQPPCFNSATCVNHDQGYSCICSSGYMGENCSQRIETSSPLIKPSFISLPTTDALSVDFGEPLTLPCQADGNPIPTYEWYKDGVLIPGATRSSLHIQEVLPDDRGNYSCRATNSEGAILSGSTHVSIPGVQQYEGVLECNMSINISEEALTLILNPIYLNDHDIIFSIVDKSNTSENIVVLVTVLSKQMMSQHLETRNKLLTLELARVCPVRSLIRFDGCSVNQQSDLNIGESIEVPCPCHEYLQTIPGVRDQNARRVCGGTYKNGAQLQENDLSQCTTIASGTTLDLCFATLNVHEYPIEALQNTLNYTADRYPLNSIAEITLLSRVIEGLAAHAITNPMIVDGFLTLIDYFQRLDYGMVDRSQDLTNSSTRVLNSLERFVSSADNTSDPNGNTIVTKYTYQSYGIALVDASMTEFQGQTFIARQREDSLTNGTRWSMMVDFGPESDNLTLMDNLIAKIHLPQQLLNNNCTAAVDTQRVAFIILHSDILFSSVGGSQGEITSAVIAAKVVNCTFEKTSAPITISFNILDQGDSTKSCVSWLVDAGLWSIVSCQSSREVSSGLMKCECHVDSYFGVISRSPSFAIIEVSVHTYIALSLSSIFLMVAFVIGVNFSICRCQNFSNFEGIILIILILTLELEYILFIAGASVTSIPALCGAVSGLQHYLTLVFFNWIMVYSFWVYLGLFSFCGWSKESKMRFVKATLFLSWILPLLVVTITASAWSDSYVSTYFCGVIEQPLYFGLVLPLSFISIIHFILSICILSKINRYHRELSTSNPTDSPRKMFGTTKAKYSIAIITTTFITFYFSFIFGQLSTNPRLQNYSVFLQIAFAIVVIAQGPLVFIYTLFSISSLKTLWIWKVFCCCKSMRPMGIDNTNADLPPTTDTSAQSSQAATLNFTTKENKDKGSKMIATNTNPAYELVMLRRKKEEYTMTENELYGTRKKQGIYIG